MSDVTTPGAPSLPILKSPPGARPTARPPAGDDAAATAVAALRGGLAAAWAARRNVVVAAIANLALAALILLPLYGALDASLSHRPDASRIGREFDYRWWTDLGVSQSALFGAGAGMLSAAGILMAVASAFFAGGLLEALKIGPRPALSFEPLPDPFYRGATPEWRSASPGPLSVQSFLRESARHFARFVLLLALSLPLYWLIHQLLNVLAVSLLDSLLEGVADERLGVALTIARALAFAGCFQMVSVVFEYARAQAVLRPGASLRELLGLPVALALARPGVFFGIELGCLVLQVGAMLVFIPIDRALAYWSPVAATAGMLTFQLFLFTRLLIRTGGQAAQLRLVRSWLDRER
ncbi:MAG TPA: hypothetical protein VE404_01235 [Verrucomicrobiae bacterium]|nr:hypothetical protein [Verrucomicrobiae bacterium]